jgi:hypothetical protein
MADPTRREATVSWHDAAELVPHLTTLDGLAYDAFLRTSAAGSALRCTGEALRAGGRLGHVRAEVRDDGDNLLATGQTTHAVLTFA